MELLNGSLNDPDFSNILNNLYKLIIFQQAFIGLDFIHSYDLIYCDFHLGNILFDITGSLKLYLGKLGDLGSVITKKKLSESVTNVKGNLSHLAPEVLRREKENFRKT